MIYKESDMFAENLLLEGCMCIAVHCNSYLQEEGAEK